MADWRRLLSGDPTPWLLEEDDAAVRHLALRLLLDEPAEAPAVRRARTRAMRTPPIATVLEHQDARGFWEKLWSDVDRPGVPSKWVTLRACVFLKQAA